MPEWEYANYIRGPDRLRGRKKTKPLSYLLVGNRRWMPLPGYLEHLDSAPPPLSLKAFFCKGLEHRLIWVFLGDSGASLLEMLRNKSMIKYGI